jgi:U32 family peptidase
MSKVNLPELLAPAGSIDTLKAGVNAGADAVYLSGKRFGARQFARNFSTSEMEEAINYAHLRGVKVYVTVNTLIKETELSKVGDHLLQLYSLGADAVIVQDLGVARLVQEIIPELDLHCSTQMTIHTQQGVNWALDNGFKRVVLGREMHLEDIEATASQLEGKIELEVFGHGAICYSYSGQCLLSSFIGGRSGNRGMCAQPCRKSYQLIWVKTDKYGKYEDSKEIPLKDQYLLSTRDLAIYSNLDRIVKARVDSIKIEGRMRPPEYVANVVITYRKALDLLGKGKWKSGKKEISKLKMCFNRGLTNGWLLDNDNDSLMGRDNPGNRGLYLGKVVSYNKNNAETIIKISNRVNLEKGDGILFKDPGKTGTAANIWGTVLEYSPQIKRDKLFLKLRKRVGIGNDVFITRRKSLVDQADAIINNSHLPHTIPLETQIKWNKELTPLIRAIASPPKLDTFEIQYKADFSMEKAQKRPLSSETIKRHLEKTGGTPFVVKNIQMDYPGNLFTPIRNLNYLRREIIAEIQNRILKIYLPSSQNIKSAETGLSTWKNDYDFTQEKFKENLGQTIQKSLVNLAIYVDSLSSLEVALESGCEVIYFQPKLKYEMDGSGAYSNSNDDFSCLKNSKDYETYFKKICWHLKEASTLCNEYGAELIWKWPDITHQNFIEAATHLMKNVSRETISDVEIGGLGALWILTEEFDSVNIHGSAGLNLWNHMAIYEVSPSLKTMIFSPELSKHELKNVISFSKVNSLEHNFGFLVQGNLEAMVSEDCLPCIVKDEKIIRQIKQLHHEFLGIKDSKNRIFPVELDENCRTHILNSVELCLIDHIPTLLSIGINRLIIDSRNKPVDYVLNILSLYHEALELTIQKDPNLDSKLHSLKKRVKKISNGGITTGSFLRGVKEDN